MNYYGVTLDNTLGEEAMDNALRPALTRVGEDSNVIPVRGIAKFEKNGVIRMNFNVNKVKISVPVPVANVEEVRNALFQAGAGNIGNYTHCSGTTKCIGTFKPNDNANPYIGEKNKLEYVEEEKIEVLCDVSDVKHVISSLKEVHPYEEIGFEIIPLLDEESFK